MESDIDILFVGASGRMEMKKVPEAGYRITGLKVSGIQRRLTWSNLWFPIRLLASIRKSLSILREFRPHVVVGFGGYVSGPILYAATRRKIPTLIQEQNGYAGLANKWLANKVQTICVAYANMEKYFPRDKIVFTGNPVREELKQVAVLREQAFEFFQLDPQKPTLLIIGGSLGARTINQSIKRHLAKLTAARVQLIWQTGSLYYQQLRDSMVPVDNCKIYEFIKEMDMAYAAATVVVSRAGALSIAELCLTEKPVILVPSPNVAEDHQTKNARALVEADAAILVPDDQAMELLVDRVIALIKDREKQKTLSKNIGKLARPQAARHIAEEVFKLAS